MFAFTFMHTKSNLPNQRAFKLCSVAYQKSLLQANLLAILFLSSWQIATPLHWRPNETSDFYLHPATPPIDSSALQIAHAHLTVVMCESKMADTSGSGPGWQQNQGEQPQSQIPWASHAAVRTSCKDRYTYWSENLLSRGCKTWRCHLDRLSKISFL